MVETIVAGIVPGDGSRGLSFDVYPTSACRQRLAGEFADAFPEGVAPLVKAMESSIGRDPESAVRSIGKNRVAWQEIPFDSSEAHEIPALEEVDRLRELALTTPTRTGVGVSWQRPEKTPPTNSRRSSIWLSRNQMTGRNPSCRSFPSTLPSSRGRWRRCLPKLFGLCTVSFFRATT